MPAKSLLRVGGRSCKYTDVYRRATPEHRHKERERENELIRKQNKYPTRVAPIRMCVIRAGVRESAMLEGRYTVCSEFKVR